MWSLIVTYYITTGGQMLIDRQPHLKQADRAQCELARDAVQRAVQSEGVRVTAHCVPNAGDKGPRSGPA